MLCLTGVLWSTTFAERDTDDGWPPQVAAIFPGKGGKGACLEKLINKVEVDAKNSQEMDF